MGCRPRGRRRTVGRGTSAGRRRRPPGFAAGRGRGPAGWLCRRGSPRGPPGFPAGRRPPRAWCRRRQRRRPPPPRAPVPGPAPWPDPAQWWAWARRRSPRRATWRGSRPAPARAAGAPTAGCRSGRRGASRRVDQSISEQRPGGAGGRRIPHVLVGAAGGDPAAGRALEEALLDEVGLVEVFERPPVLTHGDGQRLDAGRAAVVVLDEGAQDLAIQVVEAELVHLQQDEGLLGGVEVDLLRPRHLGEVAHPAPT